MEATEIILWSLRVIWYLLILIGIGGNLALFKKYLTQKNQRLLFNSLLLWIAMFDALYLIFLAANEVIGTQIELDDRLKKTLKERTWYAMLYLYETCFSASVLTTIILAIERYLVCQKRNTNNCNFKWILGFIGTNFWTKIRLIQ